MRLVLTIIFSNILYFHTGAQTHTKVQWLEGYFIVNTDKKILNGCSLDIESPEKYLNLCGDFSFYKNISSIIYVPTEKVQLDSLDIFSYQIKLQKEEMFVYLSTNSKIVNDPAYVRKSRLEALFSKNIVTADTIQSEIEKLNLDFYVNSKYYILMKVRIKVISVADRPKDPGDPLNRRQFAIVFDTLNKIEAVKLIKSPFY